MSVAHNESLFLAHYPLLLVTLIAVGLATLLLVLSNVLGPKRPSAIKQEPFECGNPSSGPALDRFNVKFYLVAILFLVFDIEAVFIYPWAVLFRESAGGQSQLSALFVVVEMVIFVSIVLVGLTYAWRKGALEWSSRPGIEDTSANWSQSKSVTVGHHE